MLKTLGELRRLLTAGEPTLPCRATTLLYLHGVRISSFIGLGVSDIDFRTGPTRITVASPRLVHVTDELSVVLGHLVRGKQADELLFGYSSVLEFHVDFKRTVRRSKLYNFDLSDIKELFKAAVGNDYALLKGYRSEEPRSLEEFRAAWLKVLPRLVAGIQALSSVKS